MPAPDPHFRPWGTVTHAFWQSPATAPPATSPRPTSPRNSSPSIQAINDAINRRHLTQAATLADATETHILTTYGQDHPYTTNIRDLRAFITHLAEGRKPADEKRRS